MKSAYLKIFIFFTVFLCLIFYNFLVAQNKLKNVKDTVYTIELINPQNTAKLGEPASFTWNVNTPNNFKTNLTTIYYGNISTPSALTKASSPEAVGYPLKATDYLNGSFYLPSTFRVNLTFTKAERVWYRGYAKVGDDNLWTEEKFIDIKP